MADFPAKTVRLEARGGSAACDVLLRACRPEDVEAFLPFWHSVAGETTHTLQTLENGPPDLEKVRENWEKTLADPRSVKIGAFVGERLIAQLGIYCGAPHPWTLHIMTFGMMVLQEYWGRGLGRILLSELEAYARSIGVTKIEANVRTENERGLKLYTAVGYRIEGTRSRAAKIDGRYQDEYWIAKDLNS